MATITGTCSRNPTRYTYYLDWSETEVNSATNTSVVTATLYIAKISTYRAEGSGNPNTMYIDGTPFSSNIYIDLNPPNSSTMVTVTILSGSKTITHNSDGSKSITISASGTLPYGNGYGPESGTLSGTATLTTITRATAVSTSDASSVGGTSATVGGNVTDAGIPVCSDRGVNWGYSSGSMPYAISSGSGGGAFNVNITGLARGTTYYYTAYSYNSSGYRYGATKSFTTTSAAPSVTTNSVSNVDVYSATISGNVTDDNGAAVTERGFCYDTTGSPTTSSSKVTAGSGEGPFSSTLSGLTPDTLYYARAYAINSQGTSYGVVYSFTTLSAEPTVTTTSGATGVTISSATVVGNVLSDNGSAITERGFVYSMIETNPTILHSKATVSGTTGAMSKEITGLSIGTRYYFRAYATNARGTGYGNVYSFTTLPGNPSGLVATTLDKDEVSLTWVKGNGGNYTIVRRGTTPPANINSGTLIYQGTGTSTTDTGLSHGTTYYYRAWSATTADWSEAYSSGYATSSTTTTFDFVNPTNVYTDDTDYTTIPANDAKLYAQVSRDGGNTWSGTKEVTIGSLATQSFGAGETETWNMPAWNGGHMGDTNFRVKLIGGSNGISYQIYKNFGFNINSSYILTGVEVQIKAAWDNTNILAYFLKVNAYYGQSPLPVKEGSLAYDTTLGRPTYYNDTEWVPIGDVVDADSVASIIHGVTAKTTPVDADEFGLIDSAASNVLKRLTWSNIKATLKSYFDSVTTTLTNKTLTSPLFTGTIDGWISAGETWTYVSTDDPTGVIKINANVTSKYSEGMRFKMTNGGNTIYAIITKMGTYGGNEAGYTYITFLHEIDPTDSLALHLMANSAITNPYYSTQKAPQGFPLSPLKWTVEKLDTSTREQSNPSNFIWYNLGTTNCQLSIPIGVWNVYWSAQVGASGGTSDCEVVIEGTLSTANNSETSKAYSSAIYMRYLQTGFSGNGLHATLYKGFPLEVTSKTLYYLNGMLYSSVPQTRLTFGGSETTTIIRATCAYL